MNEVNGDIHSDQCPLALQKRKKVAFPPLDFHHRGAGIEGPRQTDYVKIGQ